MTVARTRNHIAASLANLVLRLGTPEYRQFLAGAIEYALRAAARDAIAGAEPPKDWRRP